VVAGVSLLVVAGAWMAGGAQSSYAPLFDGKTLNGWVIENSTRNNFTVTDGVLRVEGPEGWLRSTEQFGDFDLRVEVRFLTPDADSGIFVRAPGPASNVFIRGWPGNAYQVQVRDITVNKTNNPLWIGHLYRHRIAASAGPPGQTIYDADAALAVAKPTGEWQVFDIEVRADRLAVMLNGRRITQATGIVNPRGYIGIQGETGALEYRAIEIKQ
jgi:hypothetical protein